MLKERQCKMGIYVRGGRQRNTGPLITWCLRKGSKLQRGFKSSLWQRKGPEGTWLFWSRAEGLELGKEYSDAWQISCFLVNLGRTPRLKDLIFSLFIILVKVDFGVCFWWILPSGFSLRKGDPKGPPHQNQVAVAYSTSKIDCVLKLPILVLL